MKSLLTLLESLLQEAGEQMSTTTVRDILTCRERVKHEGLSFLTITLPSFASGFERALEQRKISPDLFPAFKRGKGSLPAFLSGLTASVFDRKTGELRDDASITAIFLIRQVSCLFKKVALSCAPKRTAKALREFVVLDASLRTRGIGHGSRHIDLFGRVADRLWSVLFGDFTVEDLVPRHGPGATAQKLLNNQKFSDYGWPLRLQRSFKPDWFRFGNLNHWLEEYDRLEEHSPKDELPVRVVTVPKTMKGPRTIAIEPVCMQYAQQGLMRYFVEKLETHPYTKGRINFSDQSVNGKLALESSKTLSWGTLDLSEASDRVHSKLVWRMLKSVPSLREACFACRSTRADVPGHGVIPLAKFASMGSALCFPIESMVFYTIALCAIIDSKGLYHLPRGVESLGSKVRVYGDDIIVPTDMVESVKSWLTALGLKVNERKTFFTGKFRESCGVDAYDGHDVTPCYMRHLPPSHIRDAAGVASTVSLGNQLFAKGLWKTSNMVKSMLERVVGSLPTSRYAIGGLHWYSPSGFSGLRRWNKTLHRFETKCLVLVPPKKTDALDGYNALLKFFTVRASKPLPLESYRSRVVPGTKIKSRWVAIG